MIRQFLIGDCKISIRFYPHFFKVSSALQCYCPRGTWRREFCRKWMALKFLITDLISYACLRSDHVNDRPIQNFVQRTTVEFMILCAVASLLLCALCHHQRGSRYSAQSRHMITKVHWNTMCTIQFGIEMYSIILANTATWTRITSLQLMLYSGTRFHDSHL